MASTIVGSYHRAACRCSFQISDPSWNFNGYRFGKREPAIVGAFEYPILDLAPLLEEPPVSSDSLMAIAELCTGSDLNYGDLNGLTRTEWKDRWNAFSEKQFIPKTAAESLLRYLDATKDSFTRQSIIDRAAHSSILLSELASLRPDLPEILIARAKLAAERNDPHSGEMLEQAIQSCEKRWIENPNDRT